MRKRPSFFSDCVRSCAFVPAGAEGAFERNSGGERRASAGNAGKALPDSSPESCFPGGERGRNPVPVGIFFVLPYMES